MSGNGVYVRNRGIGNFGKIIERNERLFFRDKKLIER